MASPCDWAAARSTCSSRSASGTDRLGLVCNATGDCAGSRALAERFGEVAAIATDASVHLDGDQEQASRFARLILREPTAINHAAGSGGFQVDQHVAAPVLTRFGEGFASRDHRLALQLLEEPEATLETPDRRTSRRGATSEIRHPQHDSA